VKRRLSVTVCVLVLAGCGSSNQASNDGGPAAQGDSGSDGAASPDARADGTSGSDAVVKDGIADGGGQPIPSGGVQASPTFGITVNTTTEYPKLSYGTQRIWDSPPFQWANLQTATCPDITTCSGGYDATNLSRFDTYLAQLKTNGVDNVWYTMARTPNFISSSPTDSSCSYTEAGQGGLGQCDRPSDLLVDGTGTNITFRKWYAFFAQRNNDATYLMTHAHIQYWEPWNEPDTAKFWGDGSGGPGAFDPLIRLMQDTQCLIVGKVGTGTITKTGETCAQVQASVGLTGPIDPTAMVVTPSYHALPASLTLFKNFLYCNNSPKTSCTSGDAGAKSVMGFDLHMKPGAQCVANSAKTNCTTESSVEPSYLLYVKGFEGILETAELDAFQSGTLPLFDGEASYSPTGFVAPFTDGDMAASWIPRFFLYGRSLGVMGNQWYTWDEISSNAPVITAWNTLYAAWAGSTVSSPFCANVGSIYTCTFTKGSSSYEAIWDNSQSCSGGTCSTSDQSVGKEWTTYRDLTGTAKTCTTPCSISGNSVPVGIKPVLLAQ
jgi:hypothetical protein